MLLSNICVFLTVTNEKWKILNWEECKWHQLKGTTKKIINIVLKIQKGHLFWNNSSVQMDNLLWNGSHIV